MNSDGYSPESEPPAEIEERQVIALLSEVYLDAGLPLEFAARSALADFELFSDHLLCVP